VETKRVSVIDHIDDWTRMAKLEKLSLKLGVVIGMVETMKITIYLGPLDGDADYVGDDDDGDDDDVVDAVDVVVDDDDGMMIVMGMMMMMLMLMPWAH
jgi:hypothetical protein